MSQPRKTRRALAVCFLLAFLLGGLGSMSNAKAAEGLEHYCVNAKVPANGLCRGPFVGGLKWSLVEEYTGKVPEICTAPQDFNGKEWYEVYGWSCGMLRVFYEFPATNAYPTIGNPNSRAQSVVAEFGYV
jgi:hypothetical protein